MVNGKRKTAGKPPAVTEELADKISTLRAQGLTIREISAMISLNKSTIGRFVKGLGDGESVR